MFVELAAQSRNRNTFLQASMFLGIHDLKGGDVPLAAVSLRRALEAAVQDGPAFIGQIVNPTIALLLREWPDDAATLLAALVRWREEHRQAGTQLESQAETHYETQLRDKLGDAFDERRSAGAAMSEAAMVDAALAALQVAAVA